MPRMVLAAAHTRRFDPSNRYRGPRLPTPADDVIKPPAQQWFSGTVVGHPPAHTRTEGALIHLMKAETFFMNNRDYPSKARNSLLDNAFAVTQTTGGVSL